MVIQAALLDAVQPHPDVAVTPTVLDDEVAATEAAVFESVKLQFAAACVTLKVWPATVTGPVRDVPSMLAATLNDTVPLPVPVAPAVTVIQLALLVAVRAQPVVPVTVTVATPPAALTLVLADERLKGPQAAANCVTLKVCPPMVTVPVRGVPAVLAATLSGHRSAAGARATRGHRDPTRVARGGPRAARGAGHRHRRRHRRAALTLVLAGERLKGPQAAANCVTLKVCPPMVTVPVRGVPTVLAATVNDTVPLPVPVAPAVTVIQLAPLVAVRAQPVVPVTVTVAAPPPAPTLAARRREAEGAPRPRPAVTLKGWPGRWSPCPCAPCRPCWRPRSATQCRYRCPWRRPSP